MIRQKALLSLLALCAVAAGQKGYVAQQPPADLSPASHLSAAEQKENFEFLWTAIDEIYAGFKLKSIDWTEVHRRYRGRLESVEDTDGFYRLLFQLVNELKDTHSWLQNYRIPLPGYGPGIAVDLFGSKPFVVAARPETGIEPGWELLSVDGLTIAQKMEAMRAILPARSSERAWQRDACRFLLAGERGSSIALKVRAPDLTETSLALARTAGIARPRESPAPTELIRQRFVHFGVLPSGIGYMRIDSFNGHDEVAAEFDRALNELRTAPALILDIRDNPGGFGQQRIVGRFLEKSRLVSISYTKAGPRHNDLVRHELHLGPIGAWQYTRPVALLVNDRTGSAADLFTCWLRSAHRVVTIGSTTHGNLSGVAAYAVLPCGLVVRISNGYVCDAANRPIEVNGNVPDIAVEPSVADYLGGRDPVLERAVSELRSR